MSARVIGSARRLVGCFDLALPRGRRDFVRQLLIWTGFAAAYTTVRWLSAGGSAEALRNGERWIRLERHLGGLPELFLQHRLLAAGEVLIHVANWTYWIAQYLIVPAGLLWIYMRRNDRYLRLRDTLIVANTIGLVGYLMLPTAPPRLVPRSGFVDTLANSEIVNEGSGLIRVFANPYAAMPSIHAADALIVGVAVAVSVRHWWVRAFFLLWPLWVCISLMATGNHLILDIAAGAVVALVGVVATGHRRRPFSPRVSLGLPAPRPSRGR